MAKISKTFKLPEQLLDAAKMRAKVQNRTLDDYLETLIMRDIELNPEIDTIDVFVAENPNERRTPIREDWMTDEDHERSQRILDRITGHHDEES